MKRKRSWSIQRQWCEHSAGQYRWDRAYQLLIQTSQLDGEISTQNQAEAPAPSENQENCHDHSNLCSGIDATTSPSPGN